MINDITVYNPYYGNNLCNLLANSLVEKITSISPDSYININVSNLNSFFMVCGETSIKEKINITQIFTEVMDTIPKELKVPIKVFDLIVYEQERKPETIIVSDTFSKYRKNYKEDISILELIQKLNDDKIYTNIRRVNKDYYVQTLSKLDGVEIDFEHIEWNPSQPVFTSDSIFGKDLKGEKTYYMLIRQIAYTLFESKICSSATITLTTNNIDNTTWSDINLDISSDSFITTKRWAESCMLDIFDFNVENIIEDLRLREYDFKNEIFHTQDSYPWMNRSKLSDVVLV